MTRSANALRTGAIVVFYEPDAACIARANRLAETLHCVVVDNTPGSVSDARLALRDDIEYLPNGTNLGVATALNRGVGALKSAGFDAAILLDQDSEPSPQLLLALPRALEGQPESRRVALVGPAYEDRRLGGVAPFVRFGYLALKRVAPEGEEPVEVDFLITSGSCIDLHAWDAIGPMDDELFIDFVDLEWCVRARSRGFVLLGLPSLRMSHELGGEPVRFLGRAYPGHSALRHYYLFRNATALMRRRYVPLSWKSTELLKMPVRLLIYGAFMTPRLAHLRMALLGILHGLKGRLGPLRR
ncbi:glycosyltransferase family 2 protein [Caballeronia sp. INDeC2]|uniref:glycosyltransferase family 2 protein n=1 Tax=Caballeronia sp. INDeC2 TaxID=2921747 RepID=UPI002028CE87|nr:glycosyltransferase family 2 protein [Caballeronia sp. INDeC2]